VSFATNERQNTAESVEGERVADPKKALQLLADEARSEPNLWQTSAIAARLAAVPYNDVEGWRGLRVFAVGNATLKPFCDGLALGLLTQRIHPKVMEGPFDSWGTQFTDPDSELVRFGPGVVLLVLSGLGLTSGGTRIENRTVAMLETALKNFRQRSQTPVLIILPEPLEEEADPVSAFAQWRAQFVADAHSRLAQLAILLDPTPLLITQSASKWYAPRFWYHSKMSAHPDSLVALGRWLAPTVAHCLHRQVKVVACDLDDTLWGGVVGENGWQDLRLDLYGSGGAYIRLQAFLKRLISTGVVLAAVSKNNESDARDVFERYDTMPLRWDDFIAHYVNWQPKSENLIRLARHINIDPSAICFLDDQPFERAEVRAALPSVIVPELPKVPEEFVPFLARSGIFVAPLVTSDDLKRNDYYRGETQRRLAAAVVGDRNDFLRGLDIVVTSLPIGPETLARVVQLTQKTNQFNLTTRRYDSVSIAAVIGTRGAFGRCYSVTDCFGDSGITGVLLAVPDGNALFIDTWLLSCRVMGRDVERAMLVDICNWARANGYKRLVGKFYPTGKNMPVADLLPSSGFVKEDTGDNEFPSFALELMSPTPRLETLMLREST
jgi:FkbH-like protein